MIFWDILSLFVTGLYTEWKHWEHLQTLEHSCCAQVFVATVVATVVALVVVEAFKSVCSILVSWKKRFYIFFNIQLFLIK